MFSSLFYPYIVAHIVNYGDKHSVLISFILL
jgi:hypothetical protein